MVRQLALLEEMAARLAQAQSQRERLLSSLRDAWRAVEELARNPSDAEAVRRIEVLGAEAETAGASRPAAVPNQATATQQRSPT